MEAKQCTCDFIFDSIEKHGDDITCLKRLLRDENYSPNIRNHCGKEPLYYALKLGLVECTRLLLNYGATPVYFGAIFEESHPNKSTLTALLIKYGLTITKEYILEINDIDSFKIVKERLTKKTLDEIFELACWGGNLDTIELCFQSGMPLEKNNIKFGLKHSGILPLFLKFHPGVIKKYERDERIILIHNFAKHNFVDGIKVLLEYGYDINQVDSFGRSALHYAIPDGHKETIKYLLERGIDQNIKTKYGNKNIMEYLNQEIKDNYLYEEIVMIFDEHNDSLKIKEPSEA